MMEISEETHLRLDGARNQVLAWFRRFVDESTPTLPGLSSDRSRYLIGRLETTEPALRNGSPRPETFGVYAWSPAANTDYGSLVFTLTLDEGDEEGLAVELRRSADFPVPLIDVLYSLRHHFPTLHLQQYQSRALEEAQTGPGAPPLACNLWLEEQMAGLADPKAVRRLYKGWRERYYALRGYYPVDARRSFRAAVRGCRQRLRLRQGL